MTIVRQRLLDQLLPSSPKPCLQLTPSNVTLVGPSNKAITTFGTVTLNLDINSHTFRITAVVADITQSLILGNDFLQSNNMILDYEKGLLTNSAGCALPVTNVTLGLNSPPAVAPAISCAAVTLDPGQTKDVLIEMPPNVFTGDSIMFTPSDKLGCASMPQILHRSDTAQITLTVHNATMDPVFLDMLEDIGYLTEGPVNADVMYLDVAQDNEKETYVNEVRPLDLTTEKDQQRWEALLKILKEDEWELRDEDKSKAKALLYKYRFLFALKNEPWGICDQVYHEIKVTTDTPIKQKPRPVPPAYQEELDEIIKDLLERGLIRESTSPWASPVVLAKKCDGSLRLCIDYR